MTLEEAKKILKKEGYDVEKVGRPSSPSTVFTAYESPEICEAMQVVCSAGYGISMVSSRFDDRKARLSLELAENSAPMPGPGEEQPEEKKGIIYPSTSPKADFYYKNVLNEDNPALKEAASQFNDALLDEQSKKIKRLTKKIARLNKIIHKKNLKIEKLKTESSEHLAGEVKLHGETVDLSQKLCDKNEDIRLSKIREKNLTEVCQKYVKEVEDLRKQLANNVVDKIDAQALKSAESALAYKEKVIAEKDEVIADLGNELAATKKELEEKTKLVEVVRKGSKEYREYGIEAVKMIRKMAKVIVSYKPVVSLKDFKEYRRLANGYSFNPQLFDFSEEEEKKLSLIRDDSVGAVTNQKNYSPFKDTHPTEESPEEVELDEILELFVRL